MSTQSTSPARPPTDTHGGTVHSRTSSPRAAKQLSRTPLVPERILKRYGAYSAMDTRFRSAARLLQTFWMRDHGIPNAATNNGQDTHLGSHLSADAAEAGCNFLNPAIHFLALREMLLREDDAAIDEDRLVGNPLSSMPLVFNCLGGLSLNTKLATGVFQELLPSFVKSVERIAFEHSPGRRDHRFLADRSAFDAAVHVITPEGEAGIIYVEIKYSEDMTGPVARWRERYDEALREVRLYKDPNSPILRTAPLEQLMREHTLAQLSVDRGITPRAVFIAIGPRLNRLVNAAFQLYANELLPLDGKDSTRVPFQHFSLEAFIDAIDAAGDPETAERLWNRYCNFQRVYDAALTILAPKLGANASNRFHPRGNTPPMPPKRSGPRPRPSAQADTSTHDTGAREGMPDAQG